MSSRPILPFLETMITQVCNLSCTGCTNYSDLHHTGYVRWEQGKQWLQNWLTRIDIDNFGIMGGEPLINPECRDWLIGTRRLLPQSQIRFTTNGLLLHKNWDIVDLLHELGNVSFKITVHVVDKELQTIIEKIFKRYDWKPVTEYGIDRWITDNAFRLHVKSPSHFIKTYRGRYANMLPWNSDPVQAFDNCCQQTCPLLYQGHIYKCSTAGLLNDTVTRIAPDNLQYWSQYIDSGISSDCDQDTLYKFLDNFGKPHQRCAQCPTSKDQDAQLDHYQTVTLKKNFKTVQP